MVLSTSLLSLFYVSNGLSFTIHVNESGPGNSFMIPEFLSITLDAGLGKNTQDWARFGFNQTLMNTLAHGLAPLYFRYGGTSGDQATYNITGPIKTSTNKKIDDIDINTNNTNFNNGDLNTNYTSKLSQTMVTTFPLTSSMLSTMAEFVVRNEWQWIFGLNAQMRTNITNKNPNGVWDTTNAKLLINAFLDSGNDDISNIFYAFELGNEPDAYPKKDTYYNLTFDQVAQDLYQLYNLVDFLYSAHSLTPPKLFGCDISYQWYYMKPFLNECAIIAAQEQESSVETGASNSNNNNMFLDGITWHHYYGAGDKYTLADFISVDVLDKLFTPLGKAIAARDESYGSKNDNGAVFANTPVILGETSSTYGGGTSNLSDSFAAGFMWLDKLGLASIYGIESVMRQCFWGADYGLIGVKHDHGVNADYWSSLLFKTYVGQFGPSRTLAVDNQFDTGRDVRVYAFCTSIGDSHKYGDINKMREKKMKTVGYNYTTFALGSVTMLVLNLQNNNVDIDFKFEPSFSVSDSNDGDNNNNNDKNNKNKGNGDKSANKKYHQYILTSYPGVLNSRATFLNGEYLEMIDNSTFPSMTGVKSLYPSTITMPALSYGFVVLTGVEASACV